jgi:hypothetical protein
MSLQTAIFRVFTKRHGLQMSKDGFDYLEQVLSELHLSQLSEGLLDSLEFIAQAFLQCKIA